MVVRVFSAARAEVVMDATSPVDKLMAAAVAKSFFLIMFELLHRLIVIESVLIQIRDGLEAKLQIFCQLKIDLMA